MILTQAFECLPTCASHSFSRIRLFKIARTFPCVVYPDMAVDSWQAFPSHCNNGDADTAFFPNNLNGERVPSSYTPLSLSTRATTLRNADWFFSSKHFRRATWMLFLVKPCKLDFLSLQHIVLCSFAMQACSNQVIPVKVKLVNRGRPC